MKKFILNFALFIIPIIIALYPVDIFISKSLSKSNKYPGYYTVWNNIYSSKANSELLIFGSSRATHHVDPDILEDLLKLKAYNFGVNGHGFWLQHLKFIEYLKYNKPPKHIILGADWFSLEKRKDLYQYNQFLPYMLWNETVKNYTDSYIGFHYLDYYIPALRYYGNATAKERTVTYAFKNADKIIPFKTRGYHALKSINKKNGKENLSIKQPYTVKIDEQTIILIDEFLTYCKEENILVSIVYTPEYFDSQHFITNRNDAVKIYTDLAKKYDLLFLDYSESEISRNKKYFNTTMHLNVDGAELFTRQLSQDLSKEIKKLN